MMKDELDGTIMMKVLCLRPKMYSYIANDDKEKVQRVLRNASLNVDWSLIITKVVWSLITYKNFAKKM